MVSSNHQTVTNSHQEVRTEYRVILQDKTCCFYFLAILINRNLIVVRPRKPNGRISPEYIVPSCLNENGNRWYRN